MGEGKERKKKRLIIRLHELPKLIQPCCASGMRLFKSSWRHPRNIQYILTGDSLFLLYSSLLPPDSSTAIRLGCVAVLGRVCSSGTVLSNPSFWAPASPR